MDMLPTRRIEYLPSNEAYNQWATTYDNDGNILQALDSHALQQFLIPRFIKRLTSEAHSAKPQTITITDLGCGTGRADLLLLAALQDSDSSLLRSLSSCGCQELLLSGLDASVGMLNVAANRVPASTCLSEGFRVGVQYGVYDLRMPDQDVCWTDGSRSIIQNAPADAMISTLVLEHLELDIFFREAGRLVRPGGCLLLTNMHSDMGNTPVNNSMPEQTQKQSCAITGAGFNDALQNVKIRVATDYSHTISDVLQAAADQGFILVDDKVEEMAVQDRMLATQKPGSAAIVGSRGQKWRGVKCWFGMILQLNR
ncbi:hypothetical protein K431DRAFT_283502 [Polychaeton citri CBS 116435]|uniref:Methyltransferase type 11 domain-containing protein n=1 Tax=Polychaeton citri CBS 116435 TaxID=1314669 RepID=A0A9P4UP25_9PEZI|nr:hypothetical protein K431DRAFT_283502 [Polychaeton citri CBS 116435]